MTDSNGQRDPMTLRIRRRYAAERRFRLYGVGAIALALGALTLFLVTTVAKGIPAYFQHVVLLEFAIDSNTFANGRGDYGGLLKETLRTKFPEATTRQDRRALYRLMSSGATFELRDAVLADPTLRGTTAKIPLPLSDEADSFFKGQIDPTRPESDRKLSNMQIGWLESLEADGRIDRIFWKRFFTGGDSREPEIAGIWGAVVGTFWTLLVTLLVSFPLGVASAAYLEEFAPRNRWTDLVEVSINNLAAVPSIVFGVLGLAVFLNLFGWPRSAPVVGGFVLALMTFPTVIISSRAALQAVPPSIREAALAVGASPVQVVFQHVLPLALPGILTGTIIGMARALGETAPLLMIGMVAFIVDVPGGPTAPATTLPVQVFLWADSPERAWVAKTSGAILVLLGFLIMMNLTAVLLRNRFERRW